MNQIPHVSPSFSPEYARWLGYYDGCTLGTKDPQRSFNDEANARHPERETAYREGLKIGTEEARRNGLDMLCDNPGFDTPECLEHATYMDFTHGHAFPVCKRHAREARAARCQGGPCHTLVPIDWL